jgi:TetR/AcrR family fatty acid metabolism transcriptional regulator
MILGVIDQESINCLLSHEVEQTLPDFERIMSLILAMIQKGPEEKVAEDCKDKEARIMDSATRLFSTKGYVKTTMLEIANNAKIAEGTLYEYFKTKDELMYSISANRFQREKERLARFFDSDDPLAKLQRLIQYHLTRFFLSAPYSAVFFDNILKLQNNFYSSRAFDHFLDYISILDNILEDGKKAGVFRADVNNRIYRNLYFGAFSHLTVRWFVLGKTTPQDILEEFSHVETLLCRAVTRPMNFNGAFLIR